MKFAHKLFIVWNIKTKLFQWYNFEFYAGEAKQASKLVKSKINFEIQDKVPEVRNCIF